MVEPRDDGTNRKSSEDTEATPSRRASEHSGAVANRERTDNRPARIGLLRRFFWLDHELASVAPAGMRVDEPGWAEFVLARDARAGAKRLSEASAPSASRLLLERAQLHLLIRSLLKQHGQVCVETYLTEDDWVAVGKIESLAAPLGELTPSELNCVKACLGKNAELSFLGLDAKQSTLVTRSLQKANAVLDAPLDLYEGLVSCIKWKRWLRLSVTGTLVALMAGVGFLVFEGIKQMQNLALHRPVQIGSRDSGNRVEGAKLVDGDASNLGFHTEHETNPFAIIDLGESKRFDTVVVYNRSDCCQERALPLFIDVSDDGTKYYNIAERHEIFEKWKASGLKAKGRYVRLRLDGSNFFHLAEVELY